MYGIMVARQIDSKFDGTTMKLNSKDNNFFTHLQLVKEIAFQYLTGDHLYCRKS